MTLVLHKKLPECELIAALSTMNIFCDLNVQGNMRGPRTFTEQGKPLHATRATTKLQLDCDLEP